MHRVSRDARVREMEDTECITRNELRVNDELSTSE